MAEGKKRLSLEISSKEAKTGASEIKAILSDLSKQADQLAKQFKAIGDMRKTASSSGSGQSSGNPYKEMTEGAKAATSATDRLNKALADATERNSDANKAAREGLALQRTQSTTTSQLVRSQYQLTDSYREQSEQIIKNRLDRQAYEKALVDSYSREIGLTKEVSAAQRTNEELTRKQARAEEMLKAAQDGRLESMLRAQRESELATKAVRASVNAMSEEEKQAEALNAAMTKLDNTRRAEAARTEALATSTGKESVRVQELRRVQEELARSTERLNLLRTEQGKRLVQQRVEAEMLTRAYREELLGSERLTHSFSNMTSAASALSTAMSGLIVYFSVAGLARTADAYTNLTNRLSSVTRGTVDVTQATRELLQVSIETRSSLESVMDIQSKMVRVNETLGKSQEEVANLTEAVSKAVSMSGASIQGAQGAIMQFAQAMSANWATSAQELNSILEQTPALAYYMVEGLREVTGNVDLTTGTLKKFAEEGGFAAEEVFEALLRVLPRIREDFKETEQTISSALENLRDSFTVTLGEMSKSSGITKDITEGIVDLAEALPNLKTELESITVTLGSFVALVTGTALVATLGVMGLAIGGVVAGLSGLIGLAYYNKASMTDFAEELEITTEQLEDLTEGSRKYADMIEVMKSTQLVETISQNNDQLELKRQELETRIQELEQQRSRYMTQTGQSGFGIGGAATLIQGNVEVERLTGIIANLQEQIGLLNGQLATAQDQLPEAFGRESKQALEDLQGQLVDLTGGYEGLTKIQKDYEKVVKNINDAYAEKIVGIEKETDEAVKQQRINEARLLQDVALTKAQNDRNKAIDEYNAKANRDAKRAVERLKRYAEETANILEQANALQLGGKALEEYNAKQQALKGLSSKDANNLLAEEVELYNKRVEAILKTNQAQQDANFAKSSNDIDEEREALAKGSEAYQEYLIRKQAIQAIGGIVTSEDLKMVDELTDKMQKLVNDQKSLTASTNLTSLQAELTARMEGEEAYQELLAHRAALQALGISEADLANIEGMKGKYKEVRDVLDDISYYADLQINPFSDLADSLERSSDVFGDFASNMSGVVSTFDTMQKNTDKYYKDLDKYKDDDDKISQIQTKHLKDQVGGYGDLLGGAKQFFDEGSKGYEALEKAQMVFRAAEIAMSIKATAQALIEGQAKASAGVANQANGDPYTAFGRIAAMAAIMAGLGFAVGGGSGNANIAADRQESQGTGTVLGDLSAKSESINNAVEYSADALEDLVGINSGMLSELRSLNNAMSGAANLIARDVDYSGIATGLGLSNLASTTQSLGEGAGRIFDTLFLGLTNGLFEDILGGVFGSIAGAVFGSSSIRDDGIRILGGTISEIIDNDVVQAYQTVESSGFLGLSSSTSDHYRAVSNAVETQFDLVFQSLYNTVEQAAVGLGYNQSEIQDRLDRFVVESLRISLRDLSPEDQAAELNAVFSSVFDQLAASVVPLMQEFQNAGEGMGETLSRVSTNFQVVNEAISQLNLEALTGTTDNILRASEAFVGLFENASDLAGSFTEFVDTFATEERQLEILTSGLTRALGEQDVAILQSREGVYDYIQALDISNEADAQRLANILNLTDSLDEFFTLTEDVAESLLGIAQSNASNALSNLSDSIQAEREALADSYNLEVEDFNTRISDVQEAISGLDGFINNLRDGVDSLRAESTQLSIARYNASRQALSQMASSYLSSGLMPNQDTLSSLVNNLSGDTSQFYGSYQDYLKGQAESSQALRDMEEVAEDQLTVEERSLLRLQDQLKTLEDLYRQNDKALEETLKAYSDQLDALNGIDNNILSVVEAVNLVEQAIYSLELLQEKQKEQAGTSPSYSYTNSEVKATADYIYSQHTSNGTVDWDAAEAAIAQQAIASGVTAQQLADSLGTTVENVNSVADRLGYPLLQDPIDGSHANGLDNVPFDGYRAELHKGEMVLTAPIANTVRDMASNSSNDEVVSLLREILMTVRQDSFNTNKKLIKLGDMYDIIDKWDVQGMPSDRGF